MKKIIIIISCLLVLLPSSVVFAQSEKKGTIVGTLGLAAALELLWKQRDNFHLCLI